MRLAGLQRRGYHKLLSINEATIPPQQPQPAQAQVQQPQQPATTPQTQPQTAVYNNQPVDDGNTKTWHGDANKQVVDAVRTLEQLRAQNLQNMPLDQKLNLVLQKTTEAERIAYRAMRSAEDFERRLDSAFNKLTAMMQRLAGGKPLQEPDPPGSSIFDEGDPESIFGR